MAILKAETLPPEISEEIVEEIGWAATEAAFGVIAERLAAAGYPVTGDMFPAEAESVDDIFQSFVREMALNNPDIAALNDPDAPSVWTTDEVYEPSSLKWVEGLTALSVQRDPSSFAGFSATVAGTRAAIREFMTTHWGDEVVNESLPNWLNDIRPYADAQKPKEI